MPPEDEKKGVPSDSPEENPSSLASSPSAPPEKEVIASELKEEKEEKAAGHVERKQEIPSPPDEKKGLDKARKIVSLRIQEFYSTEKDFHAIMPQQNAQDEKMKRALGKELEKEEWLRLNYDHFLVDYGMLHHNPFPDIPTTVDLSDPHSLENIAAQLEEMHEQLLSQRFADNCTATIHGAAANEWTTLFLKDRIISKESNDAIGRQKSDAKAAIERDIIPKPYQRIMRYPMLIETLIDDTKKLIKIAKSKEIPSARLEKAITNLSKDNETIKEKYIDPLQKNMNVMSMEKIFAYQLIKNSKKENSKKARAMMQAAEELRRLPIGSQYRDLFRVLENLKKNAGIKIKEYRGKLLEYAKKYTEDVLKDLISPVVSIETAKTKEEKENHSLRVAEKFMIYLQALADEWSIEAKAEKHTGELAKKSDEKIAWARFFSSLLENVKKEKPLPIHEVASIAHRFNSELIKIDPQIKDIPAVKNLDNVINRFLKAVDIELAEKGMSPEQLTEYFTKDKTKIANQLFKLNTPGDRRLGQLIAAHYRILDPDDMTALGDYIAFKQGKNSGLSNNDKNKIYENIKPVRDKLIQAANELALKQIAEINKAVLDFTHNPQMLGKLKNILDSFENNLGLIVSDDLPPALPGTALEKIKGVMAGAKTVLIEHLPKREESVPLPPPLLPILGEKERLLIDTLELRQALLEKREVSEEVELKKSDDNEYASLKSSYELMQPSVIKLVNKEFIDLVAEQIKHLKMLASQYPEDEKFLEKLKEKQKAIDEELKEREKHSDKESKETIIDALRKHAAAIFSEHKEEKKGAPAEDKSKEKRDDPHEKREKEAVLAMLEIRQSLIEQTMVNPDFLKEDKEVDRDKLLSDGTKENYKKLMEKYGKSRRENFDLRSYSKKIGRYKITKQTGMPDTEDPKEQQKLVQDILGEPAYRILHPEKEVEPAPVTARMLYLKYLQSAIDAHHSQGPSDKLIKMEELLGERGKKLYKAAIEEEKNDPAFINAVFLKSVENFKGPKWAKKLVLWITGPSSSGKTYVTKKMIQRVASSLIMPKDHKNITNNYVVTIDGAIERAVSQIRKLTVDASIELGYCGIEDIDKKNKQKKKAKKADSKQKDKIKKANNKLKKKIQEAAMSNKDLHMAIPDTLTKYLGIKILKLKELFKENAKNPDVLQIYSRVKSGESEQAKKTLRLTVGRMGKSRAFLKIGKKYYSIDADGNIIIESKKYSRGHFGLNFKKGKGQAKYRREDYHEAQKEFGKDTYDFDITHDMMFITFDETRKKWVECEEDYEGEMRLITRRAFDAWQEYQEKQSLLKPEDTLDVQYEKLDSWLKDENGGNKLTLQDAIIEFYHNGNKEDYEVETLLDELQNLKNEAETLLKERVGESEKILELSNKVSELIEIIQESRDKDEPINAGKNHLKEINTIKEAIYSFKMQEMTNWLKPDGNDRLLHLNKSVDLVKLGAYMAYLISNEMTALEKDKKLNEENKNLLMAIINNLQNVPKTDADQDSSIQACIKQLKTLAIGSINADKFNQIHLDYAKAKARDALYPISHKDKITSIVENSGNPAKEISNDIVSYLEAAQLEWKLEDLTEGGYKEGTERDYNNQRINLLTLAIQELKKYSEKEMPQLEEMQSILRKLILTLNNLDTKPHKLSDGTKKVEDSLSAIDTQFLSQIIAKIKSKKAAEHAYTVSFEEWLEKPLKESDFSDLQKLGRYIAHRVEREIKDSKEIVEKLMNIDASLTAEEKQKFIHETVSKLHDSKPFNNLLLQHAAAMRRDREAEIKEETPEAILKKCKDKPDQHDYIKNKIVNYLESIKSQWTAQELNDVSIQKNSYSKQRRVSLDNAITAINELGKNPKLESIERILQTLENNLKNISTKPSKVSRLLFIPGTRSRTVPKTEESSLKTQEDADAIKRVREQYLISSIEYEKEEAAYNKKMKENETRRSFVTQGLEKEGRKTIKGTASILKSFLQDVTQQQPLWAERQLTKNRSDSLGITFSQENEAKPINLDGWSPQAAVEKKKDIESKKTHLDGHPVECRGLPSGNSFQYNKEFKDEKDVRSIVTIHESNENNYVQISMPKEPDNYNKMGEKEKNEIDIEIAEAMVRLWVARCGTPVPISDSENQSRMRALVIVCKAHDLDFQLPLASRYDYDFIDDPAILNEEAAKLKEKIEERVELIKLDEPFDAKNLDRLPMTSSKAYIRSQDSIYYINKTETPAVCQKIKVSEEQMKKFDNDLKPDSSLIATLTREQLAQIKNIINHELKFSGTRKPIKVLESDAIIKLAEEFKALKQHYKETLEGKLHTPEDKKHCIEEINMLGKLISKAQAGKLSASAANDAIIKLTKSLEAVELKKPESRSRLARS